MGTVLVGIDPEDTDLKDTAGLGIALEGTDLRDTASNLKDIILRHIAGGKPEPKDRLLEDIQLKDKLVKDRFLQRGNSEELLLGMLGEHILVQAQHTSTW